MCSLTRCLNCGSGGSIAEYRKEGTCANRLNFFAHVALPMSVNITIYIIIFSTCSMALVDLFDYEI